MKDTKTYQLFEGTAQVQRLVISRMQRMEYRDARQGAESPANGDVPQTEGSKMVEAAASLPLER